MAAGLGRDLTWAVRRNRVSGGVAGGRQGRRRPRVRGWPNVAGRDVRKQRLHPSGTNQVGPRISGSCRTAWEAEGEYFYEHPGGSTVPPRHHLGGNPCRSLSRQLSSALTSMLRTLLLASAQKAARMTVIERLKMLLDIFLRIQKDAINERFYCFSWRQGTLLAA